MIDVENFLSEIVIEVAGTNEKDGDGSILLLITSLGNHITEEERNVTWKRMICWFLLNELAKSSEGLLPDVQVEHVLAEINDTYQLSPIIRIPFAEIADLGGSFAGVVETLATPVGEGLYRCVFPKGVTGTLAMAKDGSGALGTITNNGIVGQARWIPVDTAIG